jgi:hypothetical protein
MRWCFAVALGALCAALGGWYWQSGHADGVVFVRASPLLGPEGDAAFGGLSGYETDGERRYLLTDRGHLFTLSQEGLTTVALQGVNGALLGRKMRDAEGLAALEGGRIAISFEGQHRVDIYDALSGRLERRLPRAAGFGGLQGNAGLEALAVSPEGELVAIAERSGAMTRPFQTFVFDGKNWRMTGLARYGAFLPVGADFGPDGRLYVLERDYLLSGFRTRIRRFDWVDGTPVGGETLLKTRFWRHGNLEGIAVFEDSGALIIEMVSDNNFLPVQAMELVRYRLKKPLK